MTLYYCPLEPYKARYTEQLSGWMMKRWTQAGVDVAVIPPRAREEQSRLIDTGVVLDCFSRSSWALEQIDWIVGLIGSGKITSEDTIYLEDFFHPGAEAIPYCCHLKGIKPKVYAYWWAQSVDEFDFSHAMKDWMKWYELMGLEWLDGVFVACPSMKEKIVDAYDEFGVPSTVPGLHPLRDKIHVVGLPFDSEEVLSRTGIYQTWVGGVKTVGMAPRKNQVVFSSRWDKEKNPDFFCKVAEEVIFRNSPDVKFIVCTGHDQLKSNDPGFIGIAAYMLRRYPHSFDIRLGLSKEEYYQILCESKVQFNCADQDWVSFTLLEASVCGCYPLYPRFRSFPETLDGRTNQNYLYTHKNVNSAVAAIETMLRSTHDYWSAEAIKQRSWIHTRFDVTWARMLNAMGLRDMGTFTDPFAPNKDNW